jgi:hypothetical protein
VLRCLAFEINQQESTTDILYLLEGREGAHPSGSLPEGRVWIGLDDLKPGMVPDVLWNRVSGWLEERKAQAALGAAWQPFPLCAPWAMPGWYALAETWITTEMTRLGKSVRAIETFRSWCISAVLRVKTDSHPVFFKASLALPLFVNEGVVMAGLSQLYPDHVPAPLAVEATRGWMLIADLGEPIGRNAPIEQKALLFQTMARIQIDSTRRIDPLIQIGCIDRRIPWLQAHLEGLMADALTLSLITDAEREALRRALPRLKLLLDELDSLPIPPALLHGDLHTGNVAVQEGAIQIFDWTDAAVSHPFFDLDVIFTAEDLATRKILEDAYLSAWEQHYPAHQVRHAFEIARVVYGLYHAISYQFILNNLEESEREEINTAHYFLRQVLAGLAKLRSVS